MKTIDSAQAVVVDVERSLAKFDEIAAAVKAKGEEIAISQAELQTSTSDRSGDFKTRLKAHSANSAALVLHRTDLLALESDAARQKSKVLAAGRAAVTELTTLRGKLHGLAQSQAKKTAYALYDPLQISPLLPTLVLASKIVSAVPYIPPLQRDEDAAFSQLRGIRANVLNPLKAYVENASWLQLEEPEQVAADVLPSAMAEPVAV